MRGSGNGNDGGGGAAGNAGAADPAAGTEQRPHESGYCGHHIMLACAARRAVRGRGAAFSPPGDMYSYNGSYGLSGTGVRRRRDDSNSGEAAGKC